MVIELITGHVFAKGSVIAVTPIETEGVKWQRFKVVGVGFVVEIYPWDFLETTPSRIFELLKSLSLISDEGLKEAEWAMPLLEGPRTDFPDDTLRRLFRFEYSHIRGSEVSKKFTQRVWEDAVSKLLGAAPNRPSDTELLNFLDKRVERVVEGQTLTDPNGDHVANRWVVEQQSPNIRDAIHQLMKGHELNKEPT